MNPKDCPFARLTIDFDSPAALRNRSIDHGESKPGPFATFLGCEERFKNPPKEFRRDAASRIADSQENAFGDFFKFRGNRQDFIFRLEAECSSCGHRVARIHRQIQQDLLHLIGVRHNPAETSTGPNLNMNVLADEAGGRHLGETA